jgi:sugar phosphate isomerase/epimerase
MGLLRRLREIVARFRDAGLTPLHENCNNYGGLSVAHTLRLLDEVPGLRLLFDPGNTIGTDDRSRLEQPYPKQSAWEFYSAVREAVDYLHVKDAVTRVVDGTLHRVHTWPGEGWGDIRRIVADVLARGQVHTISIEPHIAGDPDATGLSGDALSYHNFTAYGRRFNALIAGLTR